MMAKKKSNRRSIKKADTPVKTGYRSRKPIKGRIFDTSRLNGRARTDGRTLTRVKRKKIAAGVAAGKTDAEIGRELSISPRTVASNLALPEVVKDLAAYLRENDDKISEGLRAYFTLLVKEIKQRKSVKNSYAAADRLIQTLVLPESIRAKAREERNSNDSRPAVQVSALVTTLEDYTRAAVALRAVDENE